MSNMAIGTGRKCGLCAADEKTREFLERYERSDEYAPHTPDPEVDYASEIMIAADGIVLTGDFASAYLMRFVRTGKIDTTVPEYSSRGADRFVEQETRKEARMIDGGCGFLKRGWVFSYLLDECFDGEKMTLQRLFDVAFDR